MKTSSTHSDKIFITCVGSRKTPEDILDVMTALGNIFYRKGYIIRSGGAIGADSAFVKNVPNEFKEIYYANESIPAGQDIAAKYHPVWDRLGEYAKKLHGRNSFQVLGKDLNTPSRALVCWTPDGCISHKTRSAKTGGTGTAISIADQETNGYTKIYNLKNRKTLIEFYNKFLKK